MPNGGPDCCGNCSHNRAVQEMAHPHPEQRDRFGELSRCTLRDVKITNPFWTYCNNFGYGKHPESRDKNEKPKGWITGSGLYEGYVRIPWDDNVAPRVSVPATCSKCGRQTTEGIDIDHKGRILGFCTNRHYVEWWMSIHHDNSFWHDDLETPEQRYKAK